jgi:hypothetical protein
MINTKKERKGTKKNWIIQVSLRNIKRKLQGKWHKMELSHQVDEEWYNIKQVVMEVTEKMIGEREENREIKNMM